MRLMSWSGGEHYSEISCSLSPLISRIHSSLFLDWRRTVSSKFFDTLIPLISTEELVLPRHPHRVLSRLHCNGHSLLLSSCLSRIGRIENPSCSACGHSSQEISYLIFTVQLRTLCAAHFLATISSQLLVHALGSCSVSGDPWSSTMSPSLGRGRIATTGNISRFSK